MLAEGKANIVVRGTRPTLSYGDFKVVQLLEYEATMDAWQEPNWRRNRDNSRLYRHCSITERT
jgi:hypothetical protein